MKIKYLVLITSVINPPNISLSYSKTRSVFSKEERFEQTKKTIETIKEKIINCDIMIIECSELNNIELEYFKNNSNYFYNLYDDITIRNKVYSKSKSMGEGTMTIEAIKFLNKNLINNYENFIKISGRYWLKDEFDLKIFDNNNIICKKIDEDINNINTVLYKLPYYLLENYLTFLNQKNKEMLNCIGFEIIFGIFIKNNKDITIYKDKLDVSGYVTVCGSFYNG